MTTARCSMSQMLTGVERTFNQDEMIVTKTDVQGYITYANPVFIRLSGYTESDLLGKPHNIIRHPGMPRVVFKLMWQEIRQGKEFFGYVVNRSKDGDHYWVFAHVTPHFDSNGALTGYHSSRRFPNAHALDTVRNLYEQLLVEENRYNVRKEGIEASEVLLEKACQDNGYDKYHKFILSI